MISLPKRQKKTKEKRQQHVSVQSLMHLNVLRMLIRIYSLDRSHQNWPYQQEDTRTRSWAKKSYFSARISATTNLFASTVLSCSSNEHLFHKLDHVKLSTHIEYSTHTNTSIFRSQCIHIFVSNDKTVFFLFIYLNRTMMISSMPIIVFSSFFAQLGSDFYSKWNIITRIYRQNAIVSAIGNRTMENSFLIDFKMRHEFLLACNSNDYKMHTWNG